MPSKFKILQFFATCLGCLQHPWPEYNFPQINFMIFKNFNIYVSCAANLVFWERVLSEKLRIWLCLFFLLVKMAGRQHSRTSEQCLLDYKTQSTLTANFINWASGSTICMNFIWIGSHAPENQTRLFLLFESEYFGQTMVLRPTSSSAVTTATIHLLIQI